MRLRCANSISICLALNRWVLCQIAGQQEPLRRALFPNKSLMNIPSRQVRVVRLIDTARLASRSNRNARDPWAFLYHRRRGYGGYPVTVCIAARCAEGYIFCASDRMVTVGDIEIEQPTPKIIALSRSIFVMMSDDDATLHAEILQDLSLRVHRRIEAEPDNWWTVKEVADLYLECFDLAKLSRAERKFLKPLGLTRETFIDKQQLMDPALVDQIARDMIHHEMPSMAAIIAGVDRLGQHIYVAHNDQNGSDLGCYDAVGFAAIGAGARHANAQFLLAGHKWNAPAHEALFLTYVAKKRAERAPGVGKSKIDMVMIGPQLGMSDTVNADVMEKLEGEYRKIVDQEASAHDGAMSEMKRYVEEIQRRSIPPQPQAAPTDPERSEEPAGGVAA
jgi:20S proteasome alpha/beta subunit